MSAIRKWIASKMFPPISSDGNQGNVSDNNGSNENGISFFRSFSRNSNSDPSSNINFSSDFISQETDPAASVSYFSTIYSHYHPKTNTTTSSISSQINEKSLIANLYQFYYANEELNNISSELDTFDGSKDTDRCSKLVNNLKLAQDRVITLIFRIMDDVGCERASRDYRLKFPDELLVGEGVESLNSQIWFGAECLAAGSTITNNQAESNYLRPIANNLTTTLEQIRYDLRISCNYLPRSPKITREHIRKLENFDRLFTSFEYDYVKAMLPIKSTEDIESLQELTYLFSDTLSYALKRGLISKEDVDGCQPNVMIALPRLSIVRGLLQGYGSVVCKNDSNELSSILRPYHSLLLEFHEFLKNLYEDEIYFLEKLLSTNYDNNDLLDNDVLSESYAQQSDINGQSIIVNGYNKFLKCANKIKSLSKLSNNGEFGELKTSLNKYISASVDLLLINNKNDNPEELNCRYSPLRPHKMLFRFLSLPNINLDSRKCDTSNTLNKDIKQIFKADKIIHSSSLQPTPSPSSTFSSTDSSLESSNSDPTFSMFTSSSSSLSVELDFLKQFKDVLKRNQVKFLGVNQANTNRVRPISSNCPRSQNYIESARFSTYNGDYNNVRRANTTTAVRFDTNSIPHHNLRSFPAPTPTTSAFSNNSFQFDLDSVYFEDLSKLIICPKKILHQVFVMISKIADKFQTNYASELRNILRTVFLLQEIEESSQSCSDLHESSMIQKINVQLADYSSDNSDLDKVEEGIDASELLLDKDMDCSLNNVPSTSQSSQCCNKSSTKSSIERVNCDNSDKFVSNSFNRYRSNSFETALDLGQPNVISSQVPSENVFIPSSSFPTTRNSTIFSNENVSNNPTTQLQSLPSVLDSANVENMQISHNMSSHSTSASSSNSSMSSRNAKPSSQFSESTATTIDEQNCDLPPFILPSPGVSNSTSMFNSSVIPVLGTMSVPSSSTATNLLLPPIWIPDDFVTTCVSCAQVFNLIRRRHHCRRCGHIFCHQCSNNFISLKCFGYAKPVRVCNSCLVLHNTR